MRIETKFGIGDIVWIGKRSTSPSPGNTAPEGWASVVSIYQDVHEGAFLYRYRVAVAVSTVDFHQEDIQELLLADIDDWRFYVVDEDRLTSYHDEAEKELSRLREDRKQLDSLIATIESRRDAKAEPVLKYGNKDVAPGYMTRVSLSKDLTYYVREVIIEDDQILSFTLGTEEQALPFRCKTEEEAQKRADLIKEWLINNGYEPDTIKTEIISTTDDAPDGLWVIQLVADESGRSLGYVKSTDEPVEWAAHQANAKIYTSKKKAQEACDEQNFKLSQRECVVHATFKVVKYRVGEALADALEETVKKVKS